MLNSSLSLNFAINSHLSLWQFSILKMKTKSRILKVFLIALTIFLTPSCKKEVVKETVVQQRVLPTVSTIKLSDITSYSAVSGGNIANRGFSILDACGVCWSTKSNPTIADNITTDDTSANSFKSIIKGLIPETTYYVRAYASNIVGTGYGNELSFTTKDIEIQTGNAITDIDGNNYRTMKIGSQTWMAENLKTTHLNDGTLIPLVTDSLKWVNLYTPGLCFYNNNEKTYKEIYGVLYNWFTVETSKLCPPGWHVPSDQEWTLLINYIGGAEVAGVKLKETGKEHWQNPNVSDNSSGFTALPGGYRKMYNGAFSDIGTTGYWFSSSLGAGALSMGVRWYGPIAYILHSATDNIGKIDLSVALPFSGKAEGSSVRCVKD